MERELAEIKGFIKDISKKSKTKSKKPEKVEIDDCTNKKQLMKFTVSELKDYIKQQKIGVKKLTEKHKADFVKIVWEYINDAESDVAHYVGVPLINPLMSMVSPLGRVPLVIFQL